MSTTTQTAAEVKEMETRYAQLTRDLGVCRSAHSHLKGVQVYLNEGRMRRYSEELATLTAYLELVERVGVAELDRWDSAEESLGLIQGRA